MTEIALLDGGLGNGLTTISPLSPVSTVDKLSARKNFHPRFMLNLLANGSRQERPSLEALVKFDLNIYTFFVNSLKQMDIG